jgi:hypothetical protein
VLRAPLVLEVLEETRVPDRLRRAPPQQAPPELVLSARLTERIFSQVVVAEAVRQALQVLVVRETGLPQALQEQVMAVAAEADRRCSRQVKTAALLA